MKHHPIICRRKREWGGGGSLCYPKPTVNSALGKVPLDAERCFSLLEHKVPLQLSLSYASQRMSSSSNQNLFGSARVSALVDSKAQPQARGRERVPRISYPALWWAPLLKRGDTQNFFRVYFSHLLEAHLANLGVVLG